MARAGGSRGGAEGGRGGPGWDGSVLCLARFLAVLARLKITYGGRNTGCTALYRFGGGLGVVGAWRAVVRMVSGRSPMRMR